MRSASAVISSLSMPDERAHDRQRRRRSDDGHVVERLRRDLAKHFAGHQRARAGVTRDRFGDPHHQAPVDDDAQRGRNRHHDLALHRAKRHLVQAHVQLVAASSFAISRTFSCEVASRKG